MLCECVNLSVAILYFRSVTTRHKQMVKKEWNGRLSHTFTHSQMTAKLIKFGCWKLNGGWKFGSLFNGIKFLSAPERVNRTINICQNLPCESMGERESQIVQFTVSSSIWFLPPYIFPNVSNVACSTFSQCSIIYISSGEGEILNPNSVQMINFHFL